MAAELERKSEKEGDGQRDGRKTEQAKEIWKILRKASKPRTGRRESLDKSAISAAKVPERVFGTFVCIWADFKVNQTC